MFQNGSRKGMIRFCLKADKAVKDAQLAGSFSSWKPLTMKKQKDGIFVAEVTVQPGTHEYKFICDGQWVADPDNSFRAINPYGSVNSVAVVRAASASASSR